MPDHSRGQEPGSHFPSPKPNPSAYVQSARFLPGSDWSWCDACGKEEAGVLWGTAPTGCPFAAQRGSVSHPEEQALKSLLGDQGLLGRKS